MSQPFKLYRLQQLDTQLDRTRQRLADIQTTLSEDAVLAQAQEVAELASADLKEQRRMLRQAEENVRQQRVKIEQNEAALYGGKVRNPKELQDLQNEVAALKRYMSVLEDRQLEAMLTEEDSVAADSLAAARLEQVQAENAGRNQALIQEQTRLLQDVPRLEQERQATAASLPEADLRLYESLRRQRNGLAVAKIANKACSACGSTLNAVLLDAARSPNQLSRCDVCGRILYLS